MHPSDPSRPDQLDVEALLSAGRPEPRADFVQSLARHVQHQPRRTASGRAGVALALVGLVLVAVASFGGAGYAKQPAQKVRSTSPAQAQYAPYTPKTKKGGAAATTVTPPASSAVSSSSLPFTGLSLWVPAAGGVLLVLLGLSLVTYARRRDA